MRMYKNTICEGKMSTMAYKDKEMTGFSVSEIEKFAALLASMKMVNRPGRDGHS
jgi:hypothetical protein